MFFEKIKHYRLILASNSPRRQQFFQDLALEYEIRTNQVEEIYPKYLKGSQVTDFLAELKTKSLPISENEILIGSDTIVAIDNEIIGKPRNYEDALGILKKLSNRTHTVITSVCLKSTQKIKIFHATTQVTFSHLTDNMIRFYVDTYRPFDKAGSYGIQEWIGLVGIKKIEGSYTNVVGFPTEMFYRELNNFIETLIENE